MAAAQNGDKAGGLNYRSTMISNIAESAMVSKALEASGKP